MSSLPIIDLIAGLIFIYFLLAIVNNSCLELLSSLFRWKAIMLASWLRKTLGTGAHPQDHFLLTEHEAGSPSYMEAKDFSGIVIGQLFRDGFQNKRINAVELNELIQQSSFPVLLKKVLSHFVIKAATETEKSTDGFDLHLIEAQMEDWFRSQMNQLTSGYKSKSMIFTFTFAMLMAGALNIDTLQLATYLYGNREARDVLANRAYAAASPDSVALNSTKTTVGLTYDYLTHTQSIDIPQLPFGWTDPSLKALTFGTIIKKAGGLFMTVMAICLGAPFWFEVLGKIANLRSSVKPIDGENKN